MVRPYLSTVVNLNDFPFQNWPIYISHINKFRLTAKFYQFSCLLAIFHTIIMLILYDMGLFFKELLLTHEIRFQSHVLTGSSASIPQIPLRFPVKTETHWLYCRYGRFLKLDGVLLYKHTTI